MSDSTNTKISNTLNGYAAMPQGRGPFPGLVVLMEAFGITGHIRGVCARLAQSGFAAVAPDFFHGERLPYDDMPRVMAKLGTLNDAAMLDEIRQTLDWLATQKNVMRDTLGVIGFCMGGRLAFLANCRFAERLSAAVGFYGSAISGDGPDRFGRTPPLGEADTMRAPILLGYGADDQGTPPEQHARIAETLSRLKKRYSLSVYPNAGHAFLCEERSNYAPAAAARAWPEILGFLHAELDKAPA